MIWLADLQRRIESGELSADAAIAQSVEAIDAQEKAHRRVCLPCPKTPSRKAPARCRHRLRHEGHHRHRRPSDRDGFPDLSGFRPRADAPVVMTLKEAGATVAGKTTTTAFASSTHPDA